MSATTQPTAPGEIAGNAVYTLRELRQRLGLGKAALRQARKTGLRVRRAGIRSFVLGKDVVEWLESQPLVS
jgi:hypothetical protein